MSSQQSASTTPDRRRHAVRVRGVRAKPGGWVWLSGLDDGWASFPDQRAGNRRVLRVGTVLLVALLAALIIAERTKAPAVMVQLLGWPLLFGFVALMVIDEIADDRAAVTRWRARMDSVVRAGGRDALRQAVRRHGRARTVGEMNVLLSSLGRTDPVYSTHHIKHLTIQRHWSRTTVNVKLTNGHQFEYRSHGLRSPAKLARMFASLRR